MVNLSSGSLANKIKSIVGNEDSENTKKENIEKLKKKQNKV